MDYLYEDEKKMKRNIYLAKMWKEIDWNYWFEIVSFLNLMRKKAYKFL